MICIRFVCTCLVLCVTGMNLLSQEVSPKDTAFAFGLTDLGHEFSATASYDSSTYYYKKSADAYLDLIERTNDSVFWTRYINDLVWIGENYRIQRIFDSAFVYAERAKEISLQNFGKGNKVSARSFHLLGTLYDEVNDYTKANEFHLQSLEIRKKLFGEVHDEIAHSLNNLGNVSLSEGEFEEALDYFSQSLEIREQLSPPNHEDLLSSLINIGLTYAQMGDYPRSFEYYYQVEELAPELLPEKNRLLPSLYNNMAINFNEMGDMKQALKYNFKALEMDRLLFGENSLNLTENYINIGTVYYRMGQFLMAEEYYLKVLDLQLQHPTQNERLIGAMYHNLSMVMLTVGDREAAERYQHMSLEMELEIYGEVHPQIAMQYNNLSLLARQQGNLGEAENHQLKALDIQLQTLQSPHPDIAASYINLGAIEEQKGNYDRAIEYMDKGSVLFSQLYGPKHPKMADYYNNRGILASYSGDMEQAKDWVNKGLNIRREIYGGRHHLVAQSYFNLGKFLGDEEELESARQQYDNALEIYQEVYGELHQEVGITYKQLAMLAFKSGNIEEAVAYTDKALLSLGIQPDYLPSEKEAPTFFSNILNEFHALEVLQYKAQCLNAAEGKSSPHLYSIDTTLKIAHKIINFLRKSFQYEETELFLQKKGVLIYELSIKNCLKLYEITGESEFLDQAFFYMGNSKALLLQRSTAVGRSQKIVGIPDSIITKERELQLAHAYYQQQLKSTQLDSGSDSLYNALIKKVLHVQQQHDSLLSIFAQKYPKYYDLKYAQNSSSLEEVQAFLAQFPGTLLLEYFWGGNDCVLMAISPEAIDYVQIPIDSALIKQLVELNFSIARPQDYQDEQIFKQVKPRIAEIGYAIYKKLCDSVLQTFPDQKRLIVIPDGMLNYLPFEVLLTQETPNEVSFKNYPFLLKDYVISYEYSSSLLVQSKTKKPLFQSYRYAGFAPSYSQTENFFASNRERELFGDRLDQLADLRFNRPEVQKIARIMSGTPITGEEATESRFKEEALKYGVLHLAMHGFIHDGQPLSSGLAFSREKDSLNDGFLYAHELYNMKMEANLAVLSACNTGAGFLALGEGVMSLSRAFKFAGCPNIIASYWQANDQSTQKLMLNLFQSIKAGENTAEALRNSKLTYLQQASEIQAHPSNWAAWVLIGNPDPLGQAFFPISWWWLVWPVLLMLGALILFTRKQSPIS